MTREIEEYNRCGTGPLALARERQDLELREIVITAIGHDPGRRVPARPTHTHNHACR